MGGSQNIIFLLGAMVKMPEEEVAYKSVQPRAFESKSWKILIGTVGVAFSAKYVYTAGFGIRSIESHIILYVLFSYVLTFLWYPATKKSPEKRASIPDIVLAAISGIAVGYYIWSWGGIIYRQGIPTTNDLIFGAIIMVLGLEAVRRVHGWTIPGITVFFIIYAFYGRYFPGQLAHAGFDINWITSYLLMTQEGVYGLLSYVGATYIILFIIFGAFLQECKATDFFIDFAKAMTGRWRGGPAQTAVMASGMMGMIQGSAVSNIVTTGTFTIPLMKRTGYKPHIAGAVETAASVGGQILPPVMGAAVFVMSEFTNIPYLEIVKVSFMPAMFYYLSLSFTLYFKACREGIEKIPKSELPSLKEILLTRGQFFLPVIVIIVILVLHYSPGYAAFWGIITTVACAQMRKETRIGLHGIVRALILGATNSLVFGCLVGALGIVMGVVNLTGLGIRFSALLVHASGGHLPLMILLTYVASLVLGMGLPTTAAYILLVVLAAPAFIKLGISVMAAHLLVIWYSQDSNFSPPVCVGAFTAAGIARADPWKTGVASLMIAKFYIILPILFIYTPILLDGPLSAVLKVMFTTAICVATFPAAMEGYFIRRTTMWERILLFICSALLLWPAMITTYVGLGILVIVVLSQVSIKKQEPGMRLGPELG